MNRELILTGPNQIQWQDAPEPAPGPGEVRVQCQFAAEKHGTMAAFVKGYGNARGRWDSQYQLHRPGEGMSWQYPITLGNMAVGHVDALGDNATQFAVGDRVVCYSPFRKVTTVPQRACWKIGPDVPWQSAVCGDPALFALGAIRDGNVRLGDRVVVFGLGAIGLVAVQLAVAAGATVFASDPVAERRDLARQLGAVETFGEAGQDIGLLLKERRNKLGVDVAIDFSGAVPALQAALRGLAYGGTIVCGAFPPPHKTGLDLGAEAHMNRPKIVFSRACSDPNPEHPRWSEARLLSVAIESINKGLIDGRPIVGPIVSLNELADAYATIAADPGKGVKLGVDYSKA